METYEQLGQFYLGKQVDPDTGRRRQTPVLYDAKDLTTHAVLIGMTGSGKTGLGIALLEEALIDQIPVIAIDPKGDIPNLMLQFPQLQANEFRPWIDSRQATAKGRTVDQFAADEARRWQAGLEEWDQSGERIARLQAAAEVCVYTPGSRIGRPVSVLRSFAPPAALAQQDRDSFTEAIQATVSGLLGLLGIEADPITSREHVLLANIFEAVWQAGQALDLATLIQKIQAPPFERIGVMELEMIYPAKERFALAMQLNNLLAAPGFETWMEGDPLSIDNLLYTAQGRPRASIFSIAHLTDAERMFFVTRLLNEVVAWMRTQSGTGSLRALIYMDEIYGFFPPVKNPPAKAPLMTLLKQARAYGLGVVLATQNPVDLDYKGLSNTGTWFIGRLQTEQDQARVMDGLMGAGAGIDPQQLGRTLAGLSPRTFLLHNVHDDLPVLMQTRWVLSYLSGPMTREQLKGLKEMDRPESVTGPSPGAAAPAQAAGPAPAEAAPPPLVPLAEVVAAPPTTPDGVAVGFVPASGAGQGLSYRPALLGEVGLAYVNARHNLREHRDLILCAVINDGPVPVDWETAQMLAIHPTDLERHPLPGAAFAPLPKAAKRGANFTKWGKNLLRWAKKEKPLVLLRAPRLKQISQPDEDESRFRARLAQVMREQRDLKAEKLRRKYETQYARLETRLLRAEQTIAREQEQAKSRKVETAISFGSAILGAFLGRKKVSARSTYRMGTALKSAGRMRKETMDVARAEELAAAARENLQSLETRFQEDMDNLDLQHDAATEEIEPITIPPKAGDSHLNALVLVWLPYRRDTLGEWAPDWK
jgi:hypothetical protein